MTKLKELRLSKKLTQQELADIIGVPVVTYQYAERDIESAQFILCLKLAKFFRIHFADLIDDKMLSEDAREVPLINKENPND